MSLNWVEINTVLNELALAGMHIQKIRQPDYKKMVLDLYRPGKQCSLLLCLEPSAARLHFLSQPLPNKLKLQRFAQLLRSKINGGVITEVSQPGNQRLIQIKLRCGGQPFFLWLRLFQPNLILTDAEGTVIDALFRRPTQHEMSGCLFSPPIASMPPPPPLSLRSFSPALSATLPPDACFWQKIEAEYRLRETEAELERCRRQALRRVDRLLQTTLDKIERLTERKALITDPSLEKEQGELLLAHLSSVPVGSSSFRTQNWFRNQAPIDIPLDPALSPAENAQRFFSRYKKAQTESIRLEEELTLLHRQSEEVKKEELWIRETENADALLQWLRRRQPSQHPRSPAADAPPGLQFQSQSFSILVGRTAKENDALLRRYVRGNDMWMHTRDTPGGYVFIKTQPGKTVPLAVLLDAAHLAVHFSKAKSGKAADLYYTQVKYLRRAKNGPVGLVLPTHEKNFHVTIEEARLTALLGKSANSNDPPTPTNSG